MEAIILAGGRGTRLSPVVPDLPKPMAPIAGKPFLSYLLQWLQKQGCTRVCLSVGYKADAIESYYKSSFQDLQIVYAREITPLGTGGAIRAALPLTHDENIFVLNGDTFAETDLKAMLAQHIGYQDVLTVALSHVPDTVRYGSVTVQDHRILGFTEKGRTGAGYINAGIYLMRRSLLEGASLPEAFSFEERILVGQCSQMKPGAFLTDGYFIDIGVPEDYARAQKELPSKMPQ